MATLFFTVTFYLGGYFILQNFGGNYDEPKWQYAYYFWDKAKDFFIFLSVYNFIPYMRLNVAKVAFIKALTTVMLSVTGLRFCFEIFDFFGSTAKTMVHIRMFLQYNIIAISLLICLFIFTIKKEVLKEKA